MAIVSLLSVLLLFAPSDVLSQRNKVKNKKVKFSDIENAESNMREYVDTTVAEIQAKLDVDREITDARIRKSIVDLENSFNSDIAKRLNTHLEPVRDEILNIVMDDVHMAVEKLHDSVQEDMKNVFEFEEGMTRLDGEVTMFKNVVADVRKDVVGHRAMLDNVEGKVMKVHRSLQTMVQDVEVENEIRNADISKQIDSLKRNVMESEKNFNMESLHLKDYIHDEIDHVHDMLSLTIKDTTKRLDERILMITADSKSEVDALWKNVQGNLKEVHVNSEGIKSLEYSYGQVKSHVKDVDEASQLNQKLIEDIRNDLKRVHFDSHKIEADVHVNSEFMKAVKNEVDDTRARSEDNMKAIMAVKNEIKSKSGEIDVLKIEFMSAVAGFDSFRHEMNTFRKQFSFDRNLIFENQEDIEEIRKGEEKIDDIERVDADYESFKNEMITFQKQFSFDRQLIFENEEAIKGLSSMNKDYEAFKNEMNTLRLQFSSDRKYIFDNEEAIKELKSKSDDYDVFKKEMTTLQRQFSSDRHYIFENEDAIKELKSKSDDYEAFKKEMTTVRKQFTEDRKLIFDNQEHIANLASDFKAFKAEMTTLQNQFALDRNAIFENEDAIKESNAKLEATIEAVQKHNNELQRQIDQLYDYVLRMDRQG